MCFFEKFFLFLSVEEIIIVKVVIDVRSVGVFLGIVLVFMFVWLDVMDI